MQKINWHTIDNVLDRRLPKEIQRHGDVKSLSLRQMQRSVIHALYFKFFQSVFTIIQMVLSVSPRDPH